VSSRETSSDARPGAPKRRPLGGLAAKLVGVDPGDCFALEDSPNGVASAEAAGCRVFAVPSLVPIPPAPGRTVARSLLDLTADAGGIRVKPGG